jgi:tetratricopeptide (TPR) repeat protein
MQQIGRYQVLGEVARGGMGVVYQAHDPVTDRAVALKLLLNQGRAVSRKRFEREAEALARVDHPNVVRLFDYDVTPSGVPYMAMEWVEGETLHRRLHRGDPLDPDRAVEVATALCGAVAACHAAGLLHRDLKPGNVLFARDGTLKLTDFGLTRDTDPSTSRTQLSSSGNFMGSPGYWAPEQARGQLDQIGEPTDVYGLGATLFAMLTGRPPQEGVTLPEILSALEAKKPAPSSLNPAVPAWLDRVVGRALATEPADRFESAEALGAALSDGALVAPPGQPRALVATLTLMTAGLLAALLVATGAWPRHEGGRRPSDAAGTADPGLEVSAEAKAALERGDRSSEEGRGQAAIEDYTQAIRLQPNYAKAFLQRGKSRGRWGDLAGAIEDFGAAIRFQPDNASAYYNRGVARDALNDRQGAVEDYTQAIRLKPDYPSAYNNRGGARTELGDHQGAVDDYTQALRLRPDDAKTYHNRGISRGRLNDHRGAIEDFERALELAPGAASAVQTEQSLQAARRKLAEQGGGG